jgi:hypothetical protein
MNGYVYFIFFDFSAVNSYFTPNSYIFFLKSFNVGFTYTLQAKVAAMDFLNPAIFKKWAALNRLLIYVIGLLPRAPERSLPMAYLRSLTLTLAISGNLLFTRVHNSMTAFQVGSSMVVISI